MQIDEKKIVYSTYSLYNKYMKNGQTDRQYVIDVALFLGSTASTYWLFVCVCVFGGRFHGLTRSIIPHEGYNAF